MAKRGWYAWQRRHGWQQQHGEEHNEEATYTSRRWWLRFHPRFVRHAVQQDPAKQGLVQIFVETSTGKRITLTVRLCDTVDEVKALIHKKLGILPEQQVLFSKARCLRQASC